MIKHEAFELLPVNRCLQAGGIQRIEALLFKDALQNMINLRLWLLWLPSLCSWVLNASIDAHVLDHIGVDDSHCDIVESKETWVGGQNRKTVFTSHLRVHEQLFRKRRLRERVGMLDFLC